MNVLLTSAARSRIVGWSLGSSRAMIAACLLGGVGLAARAPAEAQVVDENGISLGGGGESAPNPAPAHGDDGVAGEDQSGGNEEQPGMNGASSDDGQPQEGDDPGGPNADPLAIGGIQYGTGAAVGGAPGSHGHASGPEVILPRSQAEQALSSGRYVTGLIKDTAGRVVGVRWRPALGVSASATDDQGDNDVLVLRVGRETETKIPATVVSADPDARAQRAADLMDMIHGVKDDLEEAERNCNVHSQEYYDSNDPAVKNQAATDYQFWNGRKESMAKMLTKLQIELSLNQ